MEMYALMTGIAKSLSLNKVHLVQCYMGYWLGLLAVPGKLIPVLDQNQANTCVYMQVHVQEKPQWKLYFHFSLSVSQDSQGIDLLETAFHSAGLFSSFLAEAAEMTVVVLVTKMHLRSALRLYWNDQQAFRLSSSLSGTDFSHY